MAKNKKRKKKPAKAEKKAAPARLGAIRKYIQSSFLTGILVTIPIVATVLVVKFLINVIDGFVPDYLRPDMTFLDVKIPLVGTMLAILIVFFVGMLVRNLIGRRLLSFGERLIARIPIARSVYSAVKQFTQTLFVKNRDNFKRVVLIQYPRIGIYTMAFVTGKPKGRYLPPGEENILSLFVPTTPNPTSGFYLMIPEADTIELSITVEQAFRAIISAGMTTGDESQDNELFPGQNANH